MRFCPKCQSHAKVPFQVQNPSPISHCQIRQTFGGDPAELSRISVRSALGLGSGTASGTGLWDGTGIWDFEWDLDMVWDLGLGKQGISTEVE